MANTVWAFAKLGQALPRPWLRRAWGVSFRKADTFGAQDLANTLWGLATLDPKSPPPDIVEKLTEKVRQGGPLGPVNLCMEFCESCLPFAIFWRLSEEGTSVPGSFLGQQVAGRFVSGGVPDAESWCLETARKIKRLGCTA